MTRSDKMSRSFPFSLAGGMMIESETQRSCFVLGWSNITHSVIVGERLPTTAVLSVYKNLTLGTSHLLTICGMA